MLLAAAAVALLWANSPWQQSYVDLWHTRLTIGLGSHELDLDLREWINEGLMTVFFFVVGLEIKRELVDGELREPRRAALPAIAALGGMVVPAAIYTAFNAGGDGAAGWAIPMATDIAIAVGVLALAGAAIHPSLTLFLLTLAIVDDIGAIVVIAVFYSHGLTWQAEVAALAILGVILACRRADVRSMAVYVVLGAALWLAVHESGVHATLAGVVLGLLAPTRPFQRAELVDVDELLDLSTVEHARESAAIARSSVSVVEWLEHVLHPWTSFAIVPLFALANAGVEVSADAIGDAVSSPIAHGIVVGLVIGKLGGVAGATWLAVRLGIGELPAGATWRGIIGVAALAGIGFTVSLFVTGLAFVDPRHQDEAKIAILAASTTAALVGMTILRWRPGAGRRAGKLSP